MHGNAMQQQTAHVQAIQGIWVFIVVLLLNGKKKAARKGRLFVCAVNAVYASP